MKIKKIIFVMMAIICSMIFILSGCGKNETTDKIMSNNIMDSQVDTTAVSDRNIIMNINKKKQIVKIFNIDSASEVKYFYIGATYIQDKYGENMSMDQLNKGDIIDITYTQSDDTAQLIKISDTAWESVSTGELNRDTDKSSLEVNGTKYRYTSDLKIFSEGKEIELSDISAQDELILRGFDKQVNVIIVDKGHGYIKLENDEDVIGGWIEVGNKIIEVITENMILIAPEGEYAVKIYKDGYGGTAELTVENNKEYTLDVSKFNKRLNDYGMVKFNLTPKDAVMYIDGDKKDPSVSFDLDYGKHTIVVAADGYISKKLTLNVKSSSATIDITLEKSDDDSDEEQDKDKDTESDNTDASKTTTTPTPTPTTNNTQDTPKKTDTDDTYTSKTNTTVKYKVTVETPEDVEVYLDGVYQGVVPVSFEKVAGSHTITLRNSGYVNKSYEVEISDDNTDATYAFPKLEKNTDAE